MASPQISSVLPAEQPQESVVMRAFVTEKLCDRAAEKLKKQIRARNAKVEPEKKEPEKQIRERDAKIGPEEEESEKQIRERDAKAGPEEEELEKQIRARDAKAGPEEEESEKQIRARDAKAGPEEEELGMRKVTMKVTTEAKLKNMSYEQIVGALPRGTYEKFQKATLKSAVSDLAHYMLSPARFSFPLNVKLTWQMPAEEACKHPFSGAAYEGDKTHRETVVVRLLGVKNAAPASRLELISTALLRYGNFAMIDWAIAISTDDEVRLRMLDTVIEACIRYNLALILDWVARGIIDYEAVKLLPLLSYLADEFGHHSPLTDWLRHKKIVPEQQGGVTAATSRAITIENDLKAAAKFFAYCEGVCNSKTRKNVMVKAAERLADYWVEHGYDAHFKGFSATTKDSPIFQDWPTLLVEAYRRLGIAARDLGNFGSGQDCEAAENVCSSTVDSLRIKPAV